MSRQSWRVAARAAVAILVMTCVAANAGSLRVGPVRIELSPQKPVGTLEVRNTGSTPVTVQLERMLWTQSDGQDVYVPTRELIATPAVFELAQGASQTLRVGLRDWSALTGERAFRVYVREVPTATASADGGLRVALRIGVPVFAGEAQTPSTRLEGELRADSNGRATLILRNVGKKFARALAIEAYRAGSEQAVWRTDTPAYVVAGGEYHWTEAALASLHPGERVELVIRTESETVREPVPVTH